MTFASSQKRNKYITIDADEPEVELNQEKKKERNLEIGVFGISAMHYDLFDDYQPYTFSPQLGIRAYKGRFFLAIKLMPLGAEMRRKDDLLSEYASIKEHDLFVGWQFRDRVFRPYLAVGLGTLNLNRRATYFLSSNRVDVRSFESYFIWPTELGMDFLLERFNVNFSFSAWYIYVPEIMKGPSSLEQVLYFQMIARLGTSFRF
ncbi:MAG: hypothetical protein JW812_00025 [Alphaproteobacteria bacterium]|nr:hypothetical protein [Alphaproteobacteria bacterium]MBN2779867.1 hypothetical protein [Alphaproteobacteria bacterium]